MSPASAASTDESVASGEAYLNDTPVLRPHAGIQPDLHLCWNAIRVGVTALDIVVHLHGFSRDGATMPLAEKVASAGLDQSGRSRPTLTLVPRGNWLRYSWHDFPALLAGGIDRPVEYGSERFATALARAGMLPPECAVRIRCDRRRAAAAGRILCVRRALWPGSLRRQPDARFGGGRPLARRTPGRRTGATRARCASSTSNRRPARFFAKSRR
jgi:hypothetical protein